MKITNQKLFLSARWENLCLITYKIPPEKLSPYMPSGLTADTIEGNAFVSLVAFDFLDAKVKGIKFPFHINFPEVNLRFYVKSEKNRGVVFIREFVPRYFISFFANKLYNENYKCIKMKSSTVVNHELIVTHEIFFNREKYSIGLTAEKESYLSSEISLEHFFKEHEWGFGMSKSGETLVYRVEHQFWKTFPVREYSLNFDFGKIYGMDWDFLNAEKPFNLTLAKGSEIKVFSPCRFTAGT